MNITRKFILIISFLSYAFVFGQESKTPVSPKEFETLVTTKGKTYNKVKIKQVTPSGISISHEAGAATIPYENLPKEIQEQLGGFDEEEAKKHKERDTEAQRAQEILHDLALMEAQKQKDAAKDAKLVEESKALVNIRIHQITDGGALCNVSTRWKREIENKVARPLGGHDVTKAYAWEWTNFSKELYYVEGSFDNYVDGDIRSCWIMPAGRYEYVNTLGAKSTIRKLVIVNDPETKD